jgi:hypothetical protein
MVSILPFCLQLEKANDQFIKPLDDLRKKKSGDVKVS